MTQRSIDVDIPPGIETGATQTIAGVGHRSNPDRPPGDLDVVVQVSGHPDFTREGDDIRSIFSIDFATAALGGEVEVPTVYGRKVLRVPAGTQHGDMLNVPRAGIPRRRGGIGEHRVSVELRVPTDVSERTREIILELERELRAHDARRERSLLGKVREWFQ